MNRPPRRQQPNLLTGVLSIARGRPEGLVCFGATPQALLISFAPMGGLLLAGLLEGASQGIGLLRVLALLLPPLCALLAPPILSYEFARLWKREDAWLRYAVALNWCQLILPFVAIALLLVLSVLGAVGLPPEAANVLLALSLGGYGLWLHWFLARHGLRLSGGRAALLVFGVNLGTALIVFGPRLLLAGHE